MNKSSRRRRRESRRKTFYGFQRGTGDAKKKEPPLPAALKLITGRRQTERTGATQCPNEDKLSDRGESLIDRKRTISFRSSLPCRPLAECRTGASGAVKHAEQVRSSHRRGTAHS